MDHGKHKPQDSVIRANEFVEESNKSVEEICEIIREKEDEGAPEPEVIDTKYGDHKIDLGDLNQKITEDQPAVVNVEN